MNLQTKLRVFTGEAKGTKRSRADEDEDAKRSRPDEDEGFDALSLDVCKRDAALRKESRCKGKYDVVTTMPIENGDAYCLKGLCLEGDTMRGIMRQPRNATGNTNPFRAYMTDSEWKEARFDFNFNINVDKVMRNDPSVTSLRITVESSKLAQSMNRLGEALMNNTHLKNLSLIKLDFKQSNTDLLYQQNSVFYPVADALKDNTTLTSLGMSGCVFDHATCSLLNGVLRYNTTLATLSLDYSRNFDVSVGLSNLGINRGLTLLWMRNMNITDANTRELVHELSKNTTLKTLYLADNDITDGGATILARELSNNTTLKKLDLGYNDITIEGAIRLAMTGLLQNRTLKGLRMSGNEIGDEGAYAFCVALESNTSLQMLRLREMDISSDILEKIDEQLQRNA